jgi:hypothetical protein
MNIMVKLTGEKVLNILATEVPRWQTDTMQDDQTYFTGWARTLVQRVNLHRASEPVIVNTLH